MKKDREMNVEDKYTHSEYRTAEVARILNEDQLYEFYYRGKLISKEQADMLVEEYLNKKKNKLE